MGRFSFGRVTATTTTLDGWLRSPALDGLQELEIHLDDSLLRWGTPPLPLPLPASVHRFSSTLGVASFNACAFTEVNNNAGVLRLPLLKKLSLENVTISEASLHALLAGCSVLESLLLLANEGSPRVKIVSPSLRSIGVGSGCNHEGIRLKQLIIEDAPCLARLLLFEGLEMDISEISAPRLDTLGELDGCFHRLQFGSSTHLQGSTIASLTAVVPGIKVLALSRVKPCFDAVVNLMKCFPRLEVLHIEIAHDGAENASDDEYRKLNGTLDIRLRKIVLAYYQEDRSHINFAKFFVTNASVLESMTLELDLRNAGNDEWIKRHRWLLQIDKRASRVARFDFVSRIGSFGLAPEKQVHDLSVFDPFQRIMR